MRADLPASMIATPRGRRPSASSARALIEATVRVGDVFAIALSGALVAFLRFDDSMPSSALTALLLGCVVAPQVLPWFCDYGGARLLELGRQISRVLVGWALTIAVVIAFLYAIKVTEDVSRLWIGMWFVAGSITLTATRIAIRVSLGRSYVARALTRRLAIVSTCGHLPRMVERFALAGPTTRVMSALDLDGSVPPEHWPRGVGALRGFAELEEKVLAGKLDQVILAMPAQTGDRIEGVLRNLRHLGIDVSWSPDLPGDHVPVRGVGQIGDVPLVRLIERPLDGWRWMLKGIEDRVLSAGLLVFVAPLLLLLAIAVKLDSKGPVFYRQRRRGFSQQPITMLKFRTMYTEMCDPIDAMNVRQAERGDARVTNVGRILRRTSLDELPQLINVFLGDMSLVGPRPHAVAHDMLYAEQIDDYLGRHRVKPGITGWAQVNGYRGETQTVEEMRRRIELDLEYIDNWSLWLDFRILVRTLFVGFYHARAY